MRPTPSFPLRSLGLTSRHLSTRNGTNSPGLSCTLSDIIKLTALFTARRGRPFLAALSAREGRNYQFDFLRPTHSLFGYFNRLVDQYSKVLLPARETLEGLRARAQEGARWGDLEVARKRARWEQVKREQDKKREDDKEAERGEFPRYFSFVGCTEGY